ncbi:MAG: S8 family peptidase, partial [Pirellulaceae bacterium]
MTARDRSGLARKPGFETLETRIVFSVDSVPADLLLQGEIDPGQQVEFTSLIEAHQSTGADYVFSDYGFDGSGQTIAVIDSGIAWDHYALGGGFGQDYRVVGGWDFAEGDANPYDDGPAGFHGTHVAGIVGSDNAANPGVAAGVDLVGLRVFDDNGTGNLEWVEQALQWVHDHKNDFANPITAVNLSLGVEWNSSYLPGWATLEDEFAQLEADNIFISVAAGNSFSRYNEAGLAYPAVSDHVVPVASHGADGKISDFSQRHDRVIVAPGESMLSTVPDHVLGASQHDSWLRASGTSMAAPYTAGASAVLREAMQFMGHTNIDQDALYDHFRNTADQIFDSVTGGVYHRLNLAAAVDAVVHDLHGTAGNNATSLGTVQGGESLSGTIGKLTDVDAFSMIAGQSGRMTLTLQQTHDLDALVNINGQPVFIDGNQITLDVTAGQSYTMSLSTSAGLGHYQIGLELVESVAAEDLGTVSAFALDNQTVNGDSWYSLTAARSGILSGSVNDAGLQLAIYDEGMNLVSSGNQVANVMRADATVQAGSRFFIKVTGQQADFDLRLLNQVAVNHGVLEVNGDSGSDHISIRQLDDASRIEVVVGDMHYEFDAELVGQINVDGGGGQDHLALDLVGGTNHLFLSADRAFITEGSFRLATGTFESIHATGDALDSVTFLD